MVYDDLLNKGVFIRLNTERGEKELIGQYIAFEDPLLLISSRGKKYRINPSMIIEIREALGKVEP
ncbi:hypothetical protein LCGC14_2307760 [marine sediment metagenome]|uniref:LSM domain-containing protein n=1 Tax=marine sediment metagenome TaxID=412755 RepID=A0A0F9FGF1_9ZZZZ